MHLIFFLSVQHIIFTGDKYLHLPESHSFIHSFKVMHEINMVSFFDCSLSDGRQIIHCYCRQFCWWWSLINCILHLLYIIYSCVFCFCCRWSITVYSASVVDPLHLPYQWRISREMKPLTARFAHSWLKC